MKNEQTDEERYFITPWGLLSSVLDDYGIDYKHITPKMGGHMADDFMEYMAKAGYVEKKEEAKAE